MRRILAVAPLLAFVLLMLVGESGRPRAAVAAPLPDANYDPGLAWAYTPPDAARGPGQSFTVLRTGRLTRAGLLLSNHTGDTVLVTFELRSLDLAGLPASLLSSIAVALPANASAAWIEADLATPVTVVAGQQYALLLAPVSGDIRLWGNVSNPYSGGQGLQRFSSGSSFPMPDADHGFRTYVEPLTRYTITGTVAPAPAPLNVPLAFAFTLTNAGDGSAVNTLLRVDLPAGFQQSGAMTVMNGAVPVPGASCAVLGGGGLQIVCSLGTMAASATYTVNIPARIISASPGTRHCARGTVSGGLAGLTGLAMAQACTQLVAGLPELVPSLSCERVEANGNLYDMCTVTVRNTGASAVSLPFGRYIVQVALNLAGSPLPGVTYQPKSGFLVATNFPNTAPFIFSWWSTGGQSIPSGGAITFNFSLTGGSGQSYSGVVSIDHEGAITELNEGNNSITIPLTGMP